MWISAQIRNGFLLINRSHDREFPLMNAYISNTTLDLWAQACLSPLTDSTSYIRARLVICVWLFWVCRLFSDDILSLFVASEYFYILLFITSLCDWLDRQNKKVFLTTGPVPGDAPLLLTFKQRTYFSPACYSSFTGVLAQCCLQEEDGNATGEQEDQVRD